MKKIDEDYLLLGLTERDADAKQLKRLFSSSWLRNKAYQPLMDYIHAFIDEYRITPSLPALREYIEDKEPEKYKVRFKSDLDQLDLLPRDQSKISFALDKARELAKTLSFSELMYSQRFQGFLNDGDGNELREELVRWVRQHSDEPEEEDLLSFKQAVDKLLAENPIGGKPSRLATGIKCIDEWSSGGLRPGQLGLILAPTGHGKSAVLMLIAWYIASVLQEPVLFLTNELTTSEQIERFLVRMQRPVVQANGKQTWKSLHEVQDSPHDAIGGLDHKFHTGLDRRLYIKSLPLNKTADDVEEILRQAKMEFGFVPKCVVIDYIERMAPIHTYKGAGEWERYGQVAKELEWAAKRRKFLCWSAVQTNRAGLNPKLHMSMEFGQGSIRHFQTAASVVGTRKIIVQLDKEGRNDVHCQEFAELKQRGSEMSNRYVYLRSELSRMYITDEVVERANDEDPNVQIGEADDESGKTEKPKIKGDAIVKGWKRAYSS